MSTDENGCVTAPDGECVSTEPCMHSERTPYPRDRMTWDEYTTKYSKGDTIESGLTEDEFYEFEREMYETCLEKLGMDFEGMHLFDFTLTRLTEHDRSRWVPVPNTFREHTTEDDLLKALDRTRFNQSVAQEEFDRAWRTWEFFKTREKERKENEDV